MRKAVTIFPRLISFAAPVIAPASTRSSTGSVNSSVCTPRSCLSRSASPTAPGIEPIPIWMRRPVRHQLGDVLADRPLDVTDRRLARARAAAGRPRPPRSISLDVDERVAERARHRRVELGDDRSCGARRGQRRVDARAERAVAVRVRRRDVDEHRVERKDPGAEQLGHVRQEDRDVVGSPVVDRRARVGTDEERAVAEARGHLRRQVRRGTLGVEVDHRRRRASSAARSTSASRSTDGVAAPPWTKTCWPDRMPATASSAVTMRMPKYAAAPTHDERESPSVWTGSPSCCRSSGGRPPES